MSYIRRIIKKLKLLLTTNSRQNKTNNHMSVMLRVTILSNSPLKGVFKYNDVFQILPPKKQNEMYQHDHPITLEIKLDKRVYPDRETNLWHRDIWEKERFEYIKRRSSERKMDLDDPWTKAYQERTMSLRPSAVLKELLNLLTLFTRYRFFIYEGKQSWFIPIQLTEEGIRSGESVWGQPGYKSEDGGEIDHFTESTLGQIPIVPVSEYVKRFRDTIGYTEEEQVDFPDNINSLFDIYFSLPSIKKTAFYMACHLYNQALFFQRSIPSLSMVASVMAIEKLMNTSKEDIKQCSVCNTPESIEKCDECGTPIYRLRSRFREFMTQYSLPDKDDLYKKMYDTRSRLSHGGLLREDLFDTGFYAGDNDEEETLRRNSLIVVNDALIHWLLKSQENLI